MQVYELKKVVENELAELKKNLKEKKSRINSNYSLAKLDFITIDNIEDAIDTLEHIIYKLEDLQERIIDRNKRPFI